MFTQLNTGWDTKRYSAELNGFYVMLQLAEADSRHGIANGKITRLLVYPADNSSAKGRVTVYDRGWTDQVPDQEDIRKVIEETVQYFEGVSVDWDYEVQNRSAATCTR